MEPAPVEPAPAPEPTGPVDADGDGVLDVADEGEGGFDFEVTDLTEDEKALEKEMKVETKKVKGAAGTVGGTVKDATTGDPVIGGYVEAVGTGYRTKTDFDGNYTLELPPGTYKIRIRSDDGEPRQFDNVVVAEGQVQDIDVELAPLAGARQVVEVKAEMNRESAGAQMLKRRESAASRDIMSRDEIAKSGGGSTSNVAKKIVGVSLVGGRFIFVRGLGHRYGNTLFDGARVPSPEPELRTVPLDIFPSSALSAINIQKTFTPDMPGDFVGGSVQLESREVPDELVVEIGAEIGANTATTLRNHVTNAGFGAYDAFGFGNLPRGLPGGIPSRELAGRGALDENFNPRWTPEQVEAQGQAMYTDTRVRSKDLAPPNFGFKATLGYGFEPEKESKFGFLLAAAYKNEHETRREWTQRQYGVSGDGEGNFVLDTTTPQVDYRGRQTTMRVNWSSIGLVKYDIDKANRLTLLGFYSREAEDETRELVGKARNASGEADVTTTRLRYVMRSIAVSRLGGRHKLAQANDLTIDWFGSYAQARRDDPAIREMLFTDADGDGVFRYDAGNDAGKQTFLQLVDHTESGGFNFTMPFKQWLDLNASAKSGFWVEGKQRSFEARRFSYQVANGLNDRIPFGIANVINDGTIGAGTPASAGGTQPFFLQENTRPADSYEGDQRIYAGYGQFELPFVRWFKVSGGVRFEASNIAVRAFNPFATAADMQEDDPANRSRVIDRDFLPSVSLIFSPTEKQNVRITGARTLARPEFRELSPFAFTDFVGGASVLGNPDLVSTKVWNVDLRYEWFPSATEVVSASVFYKYFDEPIERTVIPGGSQQLITFRNADSANNVGFELEARKNLEFVSKKLRDLSVGVSFAYIYSRVDLRPPCDATAEDCDLQDLDVSTSRSRPMQDQSPYDVNAYVSYDNEKIGTSARLLYDIEGNRIDTVGGLGLPDIYFMPVHDLNLVFTQRLYQDLRMSFTVENIANSPIRFLQDGNIYARWRNGVTFTLGLEYKI